MPSFLGECSDLARLSSQEVMTETEVEEIVGVTATAQPLSSQLEHGPIMLYSVNPPTNTISSLQYFSPAVAFSNETSYG